MELARPVRLGWHVVRVTQSRVFKRPAVLIIRPVASDVSLEFAALRERAYTASVDEASSLIVAGTHRFEVRATKGAWRYQRIPLSPLAKLLAFLEGGFPMLSAQSDRATISLFEAPGALNAGRIERWMVERAIECDGRVVTLFDLLRSDESYSLVRFLLSERQNFKSVTELSCQYGVSESHFRRLCRRALGTNLKSELRRWRAASAILGIVDGHESLTNIAICSGYASSSHLSKEIKDFLGISPCKIRHGQ
ncbi:helix-turn-helix domain-containing protein [Burkholderia ubonensis]|uniref:helix-turn-helix domain-containing protein n=1 Tax=Burkholderia ubonensis TaxID=101571 RepID=UPI0009B3BA59|nr:helix-turn-helix domain-containing protein [Burkholderia ubonensis]